MFYQVKVPPQQRDMLRFVWWPQGDLNKPLKEYRMTVHLFGATSSPSCSNFALRKTADDTEHQFNKEVADTIRHSFYVDDCLKSVLTEQKAKEIVKDLKQACSKGGFCLDKWASNSKAVLECIPEDEHASGAKDLNLEQDSSYIERALGVQWNIESDEFEFKISMSERPFTRRGILSVVSSIYDPLGFLGPLLLTPKILLQDLCRMKLSWDEEIPESHKEQWQKWLAELPKIAEFKVPKCLKPPGFREIVSAQVCNFCDASELTYGTVSYLRLRNKEGRVHCAFLTGKARAAPLKQISIPRMELTAATVAVRVNKMIQKELEIKVDNTKYWTDSTSVLKYIKNETTRFHTFVANRLAVIHDGSDVSSWSHIATELNPADDSSRAMNVDKFTTNKRWIEGPEFLWRPMPEWPNMKDETSLELTDGDPEVKKISKVAAVIQSDTLDTISQLLSSCPSWHMAKTRVEWIWKLRRMLLSRSKMKQSYQQNKNTHSQLKQSNATSKGIQGNHNIQSKRTAYLTVRDLDEAEQYILMHVQRQAFPEEMKILENIQEDEASDKQMSHSASVRKNSHLYKLDPMMENGLLRVGGRLSKASMPESVKRPIILPNRTHVTNLIMRQVHEDVGHAGRNHILSKLRDKYWVIKGNSAARAVISKCVTCRRQRGKPGAQKMADLPYQWVIPDESPFSTVGIDFFGPFEIKEKRSTVKYYGVVFTCLKICAIHIEIAQTLNTDSCINAIRSFIARRG